MNQRERYVETLLFGSPGNWEQMRDRYDAESPGRFPADFVQRVAVFEMSLRIPIEEPPFVPPWQGGKQGRLNTYKARGSGGLGPPVAGRPEGVYCIRQRVGRNGRNAECGRLAGDVGGFGYRAFELENGGIVTCGGKASGCSGMGGRRGSLGCRCQAYFWAPSECKNFLEI
jgi:hypothetical protein